MTKQQDDMGHVSLSYNSKIRRRGKTLVVELRDEGGNWIGDDFGFKGREK